MANTPSTHGLAMDPANMQSLKRIARDKSPEATKAAAQQFEALFLNAVMKTMRAANAQQGVPASDQERMFQSMLDQQFAQAIATRGSLGLAKVLEQQLSRPAPATPDVGASPPPSSKL
jgi:flagellar protein FlgJ